VWITRNAARWQLSPVVEWKELHGEAQDNLRALEEIMEPWEVQMALANEWEIGELLNAAEEWCTANNAVLRWRHQLAEGLGGLAAVQAWQLRANVAEERFAKADSDIKKRMENLQGWRLWDATERWAQFDALVQQERETNSGITSAQAALAKTADAAPPMGMGGGFRCLLPREP